MRDYDFDDYPELARWLRARGLPIPADEDLPDEGKIVPGIAVGFLVQTDTGTATLDFFVANPDAPGSERDKALSEIASELIGRAHVLGFKRIRVCSQLDTIVRRARALGFRDHGSFKVLFKEI